MEKTMAKEIRNGILVLLICAVMVTACTLHARAEEPKPLENPFVDIHTEDYFCQPVLWAAERRITSGYTSETVFAPEAECTRGQIVTFLWRFAGEPEPDSGENPFRDVSEEAYYYTAVLWAVEQGITQGYGASGSVFRPDAVCTRGQVAVFLHRYFGEPEPEGENPFTDVAEDAYYRTAVQWAAAQKITEGYGTTGSVFHPEGSCTRGQAVTFLWRAYNRWITDGHLNLSGMVNAADYGLSPKNTGHDNSRILQDLVNSVSEAGGGTIYIPAGEYLFCEIGKQAIGSHCVKMASNVSIRGHGEDTVLKPTGASKAGLDMFYFNNLLDKQEPLYLENCSFSDFVIDGMGTSCETYTSAGKGFMINLFKNCNWKNVIVKNTDATGFGVDCPIGGKMVGCIAIGCGKAATTENSGASGFGIGFGYSEEEYFTISECEAYGNKKFGFFYEHQGRFSKLYPAQYAKGLEVKDCWAEDNFHNFGGLLTMDTTFENCVSKNALDCGYYLENSKNCRIFNCTSEKEGNASFAILQTGAYGGTQEVSNIVFEDCTSIATPCGAWIGSWESTAEMYGNTIMNCCFIETGETTVHTTGTMKGLALTGNQSDQAQNRFEAQVENFVNTENSWNG